MSSSGIAIATGNVRFDISTVATDVSPLHSVPGLLMSMLTNHARHLGVQRRSSKASKSRRRSQLVMERLEERWTPASAIGLTDGNALVTFDTATTATVSAPIAITGLANNESVLGIDFRPANGVLYAVTDQNRLLTINSATGAATVVASLQADPADATNPFTALSGTSFGVDFNPVPDRLRVVSNLGQNLRINVDNGFVTTDGTLDYAILADVPNIAAVAYSNNFAGTAGTTLYGLDATRNQLVVQNPPNDGTLNDIGVGLGVDIGVNSGFEIITTGAGTNIAFATTEANELVSINLTTGVATVTDAIGDGLTTIRGLAIVPAGTLNFSVASAVIAETAGEATITVTRTGGDLGAVDVDYTLTSGTATAGVDFAATAGTLNFADGVLTQTFTVAIFDDLVVEGSEQLTLTLSNATGDAVLGADATATLTIQDNESPSVVHYAVTEGNVLVQLDAGQPSEILRTLPLLNLDAGAAVVGIDVRPSTGIIYGLTVEGTTAQLITINPRNGATVKVGGTFTVSGTDFGFDFNPVADRIRVVSNTDINLSVNPNNGVATPQATLNPGTPNIVAAAYTNSFAGAGSTTLYVIDSDADNLYIQNPATGTLTLVGSLGLNISGVSSFEISPFNNQAVAAITLEGQADASLYSINLVTGDATLIGDVAGTGDIVGLTSVTINDVNYTADERYINQLYIDLLSRVAERSGLNYYVSALAQGYTRADVVAGIVNSGEGVALRINDLYQRYLQRNADAGGRAYYSDAIFAGFTYDNVTASLLGSGEYYALSGGTNSTFVAALYLDVVGRPIEASEEADLLADLQAGTSRVEIAFDLYISEEARVVQVEELFDLYLGRLATQIEEDDFVDDLISGVRIEDLVLDLVISDEYYDRYQA